jgi:hypothetical protein
VNDWLKGVDLNFEAGPSQGTVPQWIFRRQPPREGTGQRL